MKMQQQQIRTLITAGVALGVIAVFVGIYLGVSSWANGAVSGKGELESRSGQQQAEINNLRSKIDNADSSQKSYAQIVEKRGNDKFAIDNDSVRQVLERLIATYRISIDGKLEYSPDEKVEIPSLANATNSFIVRKDALLKFKAISDLHAYSFVNALAKEMPGIIQYKSFKINKTGEIDAEALSKLSLGQEVALVDAEVLFNWYGMQPNPPAAGGSQ